MLVSMEGSTWTTSTNNFTSLNSQSVEFGTGGVADDDELSQTSAVVFTKSSSMTEPPPLIKAVGKKFFWLHSPSAIGRHTTVFEPVVGVFAGIAVLTKSLPAILPAL